MTELPEPPVPTDCDLRDFPFMPLDIARLRRSKAWLKAKRNPALAFYMVNLWTASWHELPASSLEDNDAVLADLAMCDSRKWPKIRGDVLHGWIKCSDGRLYHPVVAEKAQVAWSKQRSRLARFNRRLEILSEAWAALRAEVFRRDDYTCQYCTERGGRLEADHVIPVSRGGQTALANLATACLPCNRSKGTKLLSEWIR
ncbi:DUF1376 domain-containing protein [Paraburkholderia aspalathi]|uniref:DUF1376 domain-containing protein n=1 Tax=Paraburkholderia aspalathi TaxID=1324617 RepID=UPI0038BB472C